MSKKQDDGRLTGYATDLGRYCTTCAWYIQFQVDKKSRQCPNGHIVDLRDEWDIDWSRCTYCDNYISGRYLFIAFMRNIIMFVSPLLTLQ